MAVPERQQLVKVMSFVAGNLMFATGLIFHAFLYNFYLEALHLSAQVMGHAAAALTGGGLVVLLPAGALGDRLGPRAVVVTAAAVVAIGLALGAVATTPVAIYTAAAVAGAGSGMWRVVTAACCCSKHCACRPGPRPSASRPRARRGPGETRSDGVT